MKIHYLLFFVLVFCFGFFGIHDVPCYINSSSLRGDSSFLTDRLGREKNERLQTRFQSTICFVWFHFPCCLWFVCILCQGSYVREWWVRTLCICLTFLFVCFTAEFLFLKAKETNHLCFYFSLDTQSVRNVAYPCKIMMYRSYLPWL